MLNGNTVTTLSFNQIRGRNQNNREASAFDQFSQYQTNRDTVSGTSRERLYTRSTAASS